MGVVTCLLPFLVSPTHLRSIGHNAGEAWVIYAAALLLVCAATLRHAWGGVRCTSGHGATRGREKGWTGGRAAWAVRRWHYRGGRRRLLGRSERDAASRLRSTPTEVVRPLDVAAIDRCEGLRSPVAAACELSPDTIAGFPHVESVPSRFSPVMSSALPESPSGARAGGAPNASMRPAQAVG